MNKKLPFEDAFEQQMNNLPADNEEESWQKMKALLDEKEDQRPFAFFTSYKVWTVVHLLLLSFIWYSVGTKKTLHRKQLTAAIIDTPAAAKPFTDLTKKAKYKSLESQNKRVVSDTVLAAEKTLDTDMVSPAITLSKKSKPQKGAVSKDSKVIRDNNTRLLKSASGRQNISAKKVQRKNNDEIAISGSTGLAATKSSSDQDRFSSSLEPNTGLLDTSASVSDQTDSPALPHAAQPDTIITKEILETKDSTAIQKAALVRNKKYFTSAGIGMQQPLPAGGQKAVSSGYNGNSPLFDYIPSVYFRFERDRRWFLQAEFSYAAPQLVREFAYSRHTNADYLRAAVITTTLHLKKTYYNQVPVSFNYYVRSNWTAGIGGMYSWFHGAIAEQQVATNNLQTHSETVAKQFVPIAGYTDSFLYRSHTYLLLQTDYHWHRFSLGLRYTKDMQPYIRYTLPDGTVKDQRNWSLNFMVRFRLWKSRNF